MLRLKNPFEPVGNLQADDILLWKTDTASANHVVLLATNGNLKVTVFQRINESWHYLFHWDIPAPVLQWHQAANLLLLRTDHGMHVFQLDIPARKATLIGENAEITAHCEFGQFYRNQRDTGAVTVDWRGKAQFYKLVVAVVGAGQHQRTSPLRWLRDDHYRKQLDECDVDKVFVREIRENLEAVLVVGRKMGISIFSFDEKYYLVKLMGFGIDEFMVRDLVFIPTEVQEFRNFLLVSEKSTDLFQYIDDSYSRVKNLNHLGNLTSKLLLTKDGLCFASTSRGTVCLRIDSWDSVLDTSDLKPEDRLTHVLLVNSDVIFVKSVKGNIFTTATYSIEQDTETNQPELPPETVCDYPVVELPLNETFSNEPRVLSLTDIVTVKSFSECVNVKTGKLCFSLPLVQIVNPLGIDIVQRLDYIQPGPQPRDTQGILGCGWRLEFNYICLLAEVPHGAHRYVWNRSGVVLPLEQCGQGEDSTRFTVQGMSDQQLTVEYLARDEKWMVEGDRFRYVFGGQAVQRTVRHADFSGPVVRGLNLAGRSVAWYLTEVQSDQYVQRFSYELEEADVEQCKVTRAVLVRQISDSLNNCITFEYDTKRPEEYQTYLFDIQSNLPLLPYSTKFLNKLTVNSKQFKNAFHFQYILQDNVRYLGTIVQFDEMINFGYTFSSIGEIQPLSKITLPDKSIYTFQYEPLGVAKNISSSIEVPVQDQPKVHYTSQNVIISYIGTYQLSVEIYDHRMRKKLDQFKIGHDKPLTYILKADEAHVVVILVFESGAKQLNLLTKSTKNHWKRTPGEISLNEDELFKFGSDFVVTHKRTALTAIYRWAGGTFEMCKIPKEFEQVEDLAITTTDVAFLMCCRKAVWIARFCAWKNSFEFNAILELDPNFRDLNAFDVLDCSESERNILIEAFLSSSIYMFHNVIAVTDLQREASSFNLVIQLYHLNESLTITKTATFTQFITKFEENFDFFNQEIHVESLIADGKLQIKLKNLPRGVTPTEEQIRQCYERLLELLGKKIHAGLFQLHQSAGGFRCGEVEYLYDGLEWTSRKLEGKEQTFNIDESLTLARKDEGFFIRNHEGLILYEGQLLKDSAILSNKYFIAYQTDSDSRYVLLNSTTRDFMKHQSLSRGEKIFSKTDHMLVTLKPSNVIEKGSILTFHNLALQQEQLNSLVLQRSCLKISQESFQNVYQYTDPEMTPAGLIFLLTTKIPQEGFGHVRYVTTENGDREEFYNESKEQVLVRDQATKPVEESTKPKSVLYDSRGKLEIMDCSPYSWEKQQICYYGFEEYEGLPKGWDFGEVQIVRDGFTASGQSFGRIGHGRGIIGHVTPKDISGMFRFVCLIRSTGSLTVGKDFGGVAATVDETRLNGRITNRNHSDWYTVELEIFVEETSTIQFQISSGKAILDIDHFWFAPIKFKLQAKVYDPINGSICGEIDHTGRTKRFFYDICRRSAIAEGFDGVLDSFVSFAKNSDENGLRLKLQVQPKRGFVESFECCTRRWKVDSRFGLRVKPYRLFHVGNDVGILSLIEDLPDKIAIGFNYCLQELSKVELQLAGHVVCLRRSSENVELVVDSSNICLPGSGTILIIFLETRLIVTIDGSVLHDQSIPGIGSSNHLSIHLSGTIQLKMLRLAIEPLIRVQYIDASECVIQELKITNGSEVDIQESVYDSLHRLAFQTVWSRNHCPSSTSMILLRHAMQHQ